MTRLIRDRAPDIASESLTTRVAAPSEMAGLLRARLVDDARAVAAAGEGELLEALADVLEALYTLAELHAYSVRNLEATRVAKSYLRGGYLRRLVIDATS